MLLIHLPIFRSHSQPKLQLHSIPQLSVDVYFSRHFCAHLHDPKMLNWYCYPNSMSKLFKSYILFLKKCCRCVRGTLGLPLFFDRARHCRHRIRRKRLCRYLYHHSKSRGFIEFKAFIYATQFQSASAGTSSILCGENAGQHIYWELGEEAGATATLSLTLNTAAAVAGSTRIYEIKVTFDRSK